MLPEKPTDNAQRISPNEKMHPLEEYMSLCAIYNIIDEYVAAYDIDNEPINAKLWFPDPRIRAGRIVESITEAPLGYEVNSDVIQFEMKKYADDIDESLHMPFCTGGDLNPRRLLLAYSYGIFPWFDIADESPWWWAPLSRFVLFPDEIHISHSMRTLLNKKRYRVTVNEAFPEVIESCRTVNGRYDAPNGAWLGEDIITAYTELWRQGYVKSVEVWDTTTGKLSGGLYGVWLNGCFMGESMFSYVPSGSKIALIGLCGWMKEIGGKVIDLQIETEHLKSMGGRYISYFEYMKLLNPEAATVMTDTLHDLRKGNLQEYIKYPLLDITYRDEADEL